MSLFIKTVLHYLLRLSELKYQPAAEQSEVCRVSGLSRAQGRRLRAVDVKRLQEASTPPFDAKKAGANPGRGWGICKRGVKSKFG